MQFAINNRFKAVRTGEFCHLSVNEEKGEFVLNSESDLAAATLKEIANANEITLKGKSKVDQLAEILAHLETLNLPEMDKKPDTLIVKEIVEAGTEAEESDDDMLIKIVQAGVKFSVAMKLFRQVQTELGLRLTPKDRREFVSEILGEDFTPETAEEMQKAVTHIAKHDAITEAQARAAIRKYLKDRQREVPKSVVAVVRGGLRQRIYDFLATNPNADENAFQAFIVEAKPNDSDKQERLIKSYTPVRLLANRIAESFVTAEVAETSE